MSITDELREWMDRTTIRFDDRRYLLGTDEELTAIADRIDAEHQKAIRELNNLADASVLLPVDADGVPIRVGDKVYQVEGGWVYTVKSITFYPENTTVSFGCKHGFGCDSAHNVRHYHAPTVEDVLREMHAELDEVTALYVGEAIDSDERDRDEARIFVEYAAKLRLVGDDAE